MSSNKFNIAHYLAKTFVESKLVLAMVPAVLLFGLMGLLETPREENPQIVIPAAEITIPMAGMSPLEVEHQLLTPLENHLNSMLGVKHTYGVAGEGFAKIQVEFEVGEDFTTQIQLGSLSPSAKQSNNFKFLPNANGARGLVNPSAKLFSDSTYSILMTEFRSHSLM